MIEVLADVYERASGMATQLRSLGLAVQDVKLEAGDYRIGGTIGIERKTTADFVTSLICGRLFGQLARLKRSVYKPLLIIEGDPASLARLHPNALKGALVSTVLTWAIPILWSRDVEDTAMLISVIAHQLDTGPHQRRSPNLAMGHKRSVTKSEIQQRLLSQIPHIGTRTARAIFKDFGDLETVLAASVSDFERIRGIGSKKAFAIYQALHEDSPAYRVN